MRRPVPAIELAPRQTPRTIWLYATREGLAMLPELARVIDLQTGEYLVELERNVINRVALRLLGLRTERSETT